MVKMNKSLVLFLLAFVLSLNGVLAANNINFSSIVNVKDFGAKGDDLTDDTAAIQAAIDLSPVGSTIFFPNGKYAIKSPLRVAKSLTLLGESLGAIVKYKNGLIITERVKPLIWVKPYNNSFESVSIERLQIDGNNASTSQNGTWNPGIEVSSNGAYNVNNVRIKNVYIRNVVGDGVTVRDSPPYTSQPGNVLITGNSIESFLRQGVGLIGARDITITGNRFSRGAGGSWAIDVEPNGALGEDVVNVDIHSNVFESRYGIIISSGKFSIVRNILMYNNTFTGDNVLPFQRYPMIGILQLTKTGTGFGSVSSSVEVGGDSISCPERCSSALIASRLNTSINLIALPARGSIFSGWSGDCKGTNPICYLNLSRNKNVSIYFGINTAPPTISNGKPSGNLSSGTTSTFLEVTTDKDASCRYSTIPNVNYSYMVHSFTTPDSIKHKVSINGFSDGNTYNYYVRCTDNANRTNANKNDYLITFRVANVVDTTAPTISDIIANSITSNSATIKWTTDEASDTQAEYGKTTAYGNSTALYIALVTSHSVTISGLNTNTLHHYIAKSKDAAGNLAVSEDLTFTTLPFVDNIKPNVKILSLKSGQNVSGIVNLTAIATDNVRVENVTFNIDGNQIAKLSAFPYTFFWNSSEATNGPHFVKAIASDTAGNIGFDNIIVIVAGGQLETNFSDMDNDGIPDNIDKCPHTRPNVQVNIFGCRKPKTTKFSHQLTTNLTAVDITNLTNFRIGIRDKGLIDYGSSPIKLVDPSDNQIDLDNLIDFDRNKVNVNSHLFNNLNASATVTLFNINISVPVIYRNTMVCDDCQIIIFSDNNITFTVPHFTEYSVQEATCGDTLCSSSESCSSCSQDCGTCPPSGGGGSALVCNMDWQCSDWSSCANGWETRECNFVKVPQHYQETPCPVISDVPPISRKCEIQTIEPKIEENKTEEKEKPAEVEGTPENKGYSFKITIISIIAFVTILLIILGIVEVKNIKRIKTRADIEEEFGKPVIIYVYTMRRNGKTSKEIEEILIKRGWDKKDVADILRVI